MSKRIPEINRKLYQREYEDVVEHFFKLFETALYKMKALHQMNLYQNLKRNINYNQL